MKTVYFDHNVLANEQNWPAIQRIVGDSSGRRMAVSEWELLEIAQGSDKNQALRRVDFITCLNPIWVIGRLHIQRLEVRNFLLENFWDADPEKFSALTRSFSVMLSYDSGPNVPIGLTAKDYVLDLIAQPELRRKIDSGKNATANAQSVLQQAGKKARKKSENEIFLRWISGKLPATDHIGRYLKKDELAMLAEYCLKNSDVFYASCPTMAVESTLTEVRALDPKRSTKPQDSVDLQHAVVALACCDIFITRDRYLKDCSSKVVRCCPNKKLAEVRQLSDHFD